MIFKTEQLPPTQDRVRSALAIYKRANIYRFTNQERYTTLLNDFYKDEIARRIDLASRAHENRENQEMILGVISQRKHIVDWMVDWCWTYDPRNVNLGLPTLIPWIPWPEQIKFIEWFYNQYLNGEGGLIEKSRDAGATWLFCLLYLREWRWERGFAAGIGSEKLMKVDQKDNPDAVFSKARILLYNQPTWWFPYGFDRRMHDKIANLVNPEMESNIGGEGGDEIGRGGRRGVYLVDEKASVQNQKAVDAALSQTTSCQFDLSTPKGMNHFGQKRHSGKVKVFTFHWKSDSRKDVDWYEHEVDRLDPVIVAQEIDIDYQASVEGLFIDPKWIDAAAELKLEAGGITSAGLDVAAGGKNKSAMAIRKGCVVRVKFWNFKSGTQLTYKAIEQGNKHGISYLNYDKIGVGHAVYSTLDTIDLDETNKIRMVFKHFGVNAGGRASDRYYPEFNAKGHEIFFNPRAEWWYLVSKRFEKTYEHVKGYNKYPLDELISIENDPELKAQLSSPMKLWTQNGKIKVESKEDMVKRGIQSPDGADALIMAFIPQDAGLKHVFPGYNSVLPQHQGDTSNYCKFKIDWNKTPQHKHLHYAAFCQQSDLTVYMISGIFNQSNGRLYIYKNMKITTPVPSVIVPRLTQIMQLHKLEFHRFLANDMMFNKGKKSLARLFKLEFRKSITEQDVRLRLPKRYDAAGSVAIMNEMILRDLFFVHESCKDLNYQMSNWKFLKGKAVVDNYGMCECLLMIVSELRQVVSFREILKMHEYTTKEAYENMPMTEYTEKDPAKKESSMISI